jgi:hypothetical protein
MVVVVVVVAVVVVVTSFLFPSPALVADLDGADGEDDGDDKEKDSADETCITFQQNILKKTVHQKKS